MFCGSSLLHCFKWNKLKTKHLTVIALIVTGIFWTNLLYIWSKLGMAYGQGSTGHIHLFFLVINWSHGHVNCLFVFPNGNPPKQVTISPSRVLFPILKICLIVQSLFFVLQLFFRSDINPSLATGQRMKKSTSYFWLFH